MQIDNVQRITCINEERIFQNAILSGTMKKIIGELENWRLLKCPSVVPEPHSKN